MAKPSKLMMRVRFPPPAFCTNDPKDAAGQRDRCAHGAGAVGQLQHLAIKNGPTLALLLVRLLISKNPWVVPRGHDAFNEVLGWG
jgi:hypothetical protein